MNKGQIALWIAIVGAVGTIGASGLGAGIAGWLSASNAISSRIGATETKIATVEEREQNHYGEIEKRMGRFETSMGRFEEKLDRVLNKK